MEWQFASKKIMIRYEKAFYEERNLLKNPILIY